MTHNQREDIRPAAHLRRARRLSRRDSQRQRELKTSLLLLAGATFAATAALAGEHVQPIQAVTIGNLAQAELRKKLYFDPRLSESGFVSYMSCHNLRMGGAEDMRTAIADHWQQGPINVPTVLNSSLAIAQLWDGCAADLKEQAGARMANPGQMYFTRQLAAPGPELGLRYTVRQRRFLAGR